MATGRFDRQIATAKRLIAVNGESCAIKTFSESVADPDKPWRTGNSETDYTAMVVWLNIGKDDEAYIVAPTDNTHVENRRVLIAGADIPEPLNVKGTITRADGSVWKINTLKLLDPNGQRILYTGYVYK